MILPAITAMSFRSSLDALERCGRDLILPSSNEIQTSLSRSSQAGQTIESEEPLHADPASDEVPREIAGPEWPEIISHAAIRFPIKAPPDAHSDLMEIQIDTVRYHICQLPGQVAGSIVDCAIEAEMANLLRRSSVTVFFADTWRAFFDARLGNVHVYVTRPVSACDWRRCARAWRGL